MILNRDQDSSKSKPLTPMQLLAMNGADGGGAPDPVAPTAAPDPGTLAGLGIQDGASYYVPGFSAGSTPINGGPQLPDGAAIGPGLTGEGGGGYIDASGNTVTTPIGSTEPVTIAAPPGTELTNGTTTPGETPPGGTTPDGQNPLEQDPGYQAQKAENERLLKQAASGSLSSTKDLLLGFGSQELAKSTLDQLMQDPQIAAIFSPADEAAFLASISDNPDTSLSTLARLTRSQREQAAANDEAYNQGNLYYSGTRAKGLGDQAYSNEAATADARGKVQGSLTNIAQAYVAAQNAARSGDLSAFQAAYDRALQEALQFGTGTTEPTTGGGASSTASSSSSSTPPVKAPATKGGGKSKAAPKAPVRPNDRPGPLGVGPAKAATGATKKKKAQPVYAGHH